MLEHTRQKLYDLYSELIISNEQDIQALIILRDALGANAHNPPAKKRIAWQHKPENAAKVIAWKRRMRKSHKAR